MVVQCSLFAVNDSNELNHLWHGQDGVSSDSSETFQNLTQTQSQPVFSGPLYVSAASVGHHFF